MQLEILHINLRVTSKTKDLAKTSLHESQTISGTISRNHPHPCTYQRAGF